MKRAISESIFLGGNALIGIDINYAVFMNDLMGIIVSGTSVTIEAKD